MRRCPSQRRRSLPLRFFVLCNATRAQETRETRDTLRRQAHTEPFRHTFLTPPGSGLPVWMAYFDKPTSPTCNRLSPARRDARLLAPS